MKKKIFIFFIIYFCIFVFTTSVYAVERELLFGMSANIPNDFIKTSVNENDYYDSNITFTNEDYSESIIYIGYYSQGNKLAECGRNIIDKVSNEKEIELEYKSNSTSFIGNKEVYTAYGQFSEDEIRYFAFIYVFEYKNRIMYVLCTCNTDDRFDMEYCFNDVVKSIK